MAAFRMLLLLLLLAGFSSGCANKDAEPACITGVIVGQKCGDYALQLDKKGILGARLWQKRTEHGDGRSTLTDYKNVIGLLELPAAYRREGLRLFLKVRVPAGDEGIVPCYTDMPNPPYPVYIVTEADSVACPAL